MAPRCGGARGQSPTGPALLLLLGAAVSLLRPLPASATALTQLYPAPDNLNSKASWLTRLQNHRQGIVETIRYNGDVYADKDVNWTRISYMQPQAHVFDRYLYDPVRHAYTVDKYLADVDKRYGGIDSILLWPTYPNLGVDARNQWDLWRALPGGLEGVRDLTRQFKARGVRVLLGYQPWDQGTRAEGEPHWVTLAKLINYTDADGFNGDTMSVMYKEFWDAGAIIGRHFVGEMEGGGYPDLTGRPQDTSYESAKWSPAGWGYFDVPWSRSDNITYAYTTAPGIDILKWLDGRRMTHVCDRWAKDRTDALQFAFLNGIGMVTWENVWGVFMKMTERDGEAVRRVATLSRWLGAERFIQDYAEWDPYTADVLRPGDLPFTAGGPIGSRFRRRDNGDCAWLLVNRGPSAAVAGLSLRSCGGGGRRLFDLYHGEPLPAGDTAQVRLEAHGFGAVIAVAAGSEPPTLAALLERMRVLAAVPLESLSAAWAPLPQELVAAAASPPRPGPGAAAAGSTTAQQPAGTVLIPRTRFRFRSAGVEIEGGCDPRRDTWGVCCNHGTSWPGQLTCPRDEVCKTPCAIPSDDSRGVDAQFPWEAHPGRFHDRVLEVGPLYIDRHLVTKAEYAAYLEQTAYRPRDGLNFLVGWQPDPATGRLRPAPGEERQPVVWVSLAEARAYCAWAGKRLPHTYEWQLAAQGTDGRLYPWGNSLSADGGPPRYPQPSVGPLVPPLPDVGAFSPAGDSPFGVSDLVGTVWQYTDEFRDEHTRTVLVKGSSLYTPMLSGEFPSKSQVANWYFPKALQVDRHNRLHLMDDTYERAGTVGFRCVADHPEGLPAPYHYTDVGPPGFVV